MERLALTIGSQLARSPLANAQRCLNLYPEINSKDSPVPLTFYQRPGLRLVAQGPAGGPVRGLYRASNGKGYAVIGQLVYAISPTWGLTQIGQISSTAGTPVYVTDNGASALLVDGSQQGWTWPLASNAFSQFSDPTGLFQGATRVATIDGFMIWNVLGTNQFGSTLDFSLTIDPTYVAAKANYPDPIQSLLVNHRQILLVGQLTSETWYDAGLTAFPFAQLPGADHEHGTGAPYSLADADVSTFWLGQNRQGAGIVMRTRGYKAERVSDHAVEYAIRKIKNAVGISDAIGYCYQQDGHLFYVLTFPAGDQTWVFDDSNELWHQQAWTDSNGLLHRHRGNCFAYINDQNVVGDWQNGSLYVMDPTVYSDTVYGNAGPITFARGFPHLSSVLVNLGQPGLDRPVPWSGQRVQFTKFQLDLQCGNAGLDAAGHPPLVKLRWSVDRGVTFGQTVLQAAGPPGAYETVPTWQALGIGRDVVFEVEYSLAGEAALNGAWIDAKLLAS